MLFNVIYSSMKKRVIVYFIGLLCIASANAEILTGIEYVAGGRDSITWELDTDLGVLSINGVGDMPDYYGDGPYAPWSNEELRGLITSVEISDSITHIGNYAFIWCTGLTSVVIPEGVTSLGNGSFMWCSGLSSVTIPEGVTSLGAAVFYDCTSLESISIPESVTKIGSQAFSGCSALSSINIPKAVTSIEGGTFYGCSSLVSIEIPDSVNNIGNTAFTKCTSLTSIKLPEAVKNLGSNVFALCSSLISVNIPEGVTVIGDKAFYNCTSLEVLHLPDNITQIGWRTFEGCSNLSYLNIPKWVTLIGEFAFDGCTHLKIQTPVILYGDMTDPSEERSSLGALRDFAEEVELAGIMKYVPRNLFDGFSKLKKVTLNEEIKQIRSSAFKDCSALTYFYCKAIDPPAVYANAFSGMNCGDVTLYVPDGSLEAYSKDEMWSKFGTIKTFSGEEVTRCATPVISFDNGKLNVTCETEGAVCYYSMGTAILPSLDFTPFNQNTDFSRKMSVTVSAYAIAEGYTQSEMATAVLSFGMGVLKSDTIIVEKRDTVYAKVEDPKIIADNGIVTITCEQEDVVIFYTTDGLSPLVSENIRLYTGPFEMEKSGVVMAVAVVQSNTKAEYVVGTGISSAMNRIVRQRYFDEKGIECFSFHDGVAIVLTEYENGKVEATKCFHREKK